MEMMTFALLGLAAAAASSRSNQRKAAADQLGARARGASARPAARPAKPTKPATSSRPSPPVPLELPPLPKGTKVVQLEPIQITAPAPATPASRPRKPEKPKTKGRPAPPPPAAPAAPWLPPSPAAPIDVTPQSHSMVLAPPTPAQQKQAAQNLAAYVRPIVAAKRGATLGTRRAPNEDVRSFQLGMGMAPADADGIYGPATIARAKALGVSLPRRA